MQSPLTIDTAHVGDYDSLFHEFEMMVESDDGLIDECWLVKIEISDPALHEFTAEIALVDPETGNEYPAHPTDPRVTSEIAALTDEAIDEVNETLNPTDSWRDAGVSLADFY